MAQGDDGKRPRVGGLSLGELSDFTSLLGASEPTTTAIGPAGSTVRIVHHVVGQQPCVMTRRRRDHRAMATRVRIS
jgi:hypothetical protein